MQNEGMEKILGELLNVLGPVERGVRLQNRAMSPARSGMSTASSVRRPLTSSPSCSSFQ